MAIIEVDNVIKEYQLGQFKSLKQSLLATAGRLMGKEVERPTPFRALDGVSFSIEEGEVVGIIGTNGAGKSTLLKLLAGITKPTRGTVSVRGRVAPLIEVGAGLHPELTGRENIYLNGSIMGISQGEIKRRFDEIVGFAELEKFIDTPVKRYSSGMAVRLGFSIATIVESDILIVDEVLAVGDLAFQRKCFDRMENLIKKQRKTVLLVSHNIRQIERICTRSILIDRGKILLNDNPGIVCSKFYDINNTKILHNIKNNNINIQTSGDITVKKITIHVDSKKNSVEEVFFGSKLTIRVDFKSDLYIEKPEIVIGFHTTDFIYISSTSTASIHDRPDITVGNHIVKCSIDNLQLMPGIYGVRLGFLDKFRRVLWYGENIKIFNVIASGIDITKTAEAGLVNFPFRWDFYN